MASLCDLCGKPSFPITQLSPCCGSRTHLGRVGTAGVLLVHTKSHLKGRVSQFGLVELAGGIRLVGGFEPDIVLALGMKVQMVRCGIGPDGVPFYDFSPAKE